MSEPGEAFRSNDNNLEALVSPEGLHAYDDQLGHLEFACSLTPGSTHGLRSTALARRLIGMPASDAYNLNNTFKEITDLADTMPSNLKAIHVGNYNTTATRAERRNRSSFSMRDPAFAMLNQRYRNIHTMGCYHDPAVYQAAVSHRMNYYFEGFSVPDERNLELLDQADVHALFGPDKNSTDVPEEQIIRKAREIRQPDHSKETLDRVVADFESVARIELGYHMSLDLMMFGRMGGKSKHQYVQQFMQEHEAALLGDDLAALQSLYLKFAHAVLTFSTNEQNKDAKYFLKNMSVAATVYAMSLETELAAFVNVYDHFGYERPASLNRLAEPEPKPAPEEKTEAITESTEIVEGVKSETSPTEVVENAAGSLATQQTVQVESIYQKLDRFILPRLQQRRTSTVK